MILVGTRESSWANLCKAFRKKYGKEYNKLKSIMQEDTDGFGGISNILEIQDKVEKFLTICLDGTNVRILIQNNGITEVESKEILFNFIKCVDVISAGYNFALAVEHTF